MRLCLLASLAVLLLTGCENPTKLNQLEEATFIHFVSKGNPNKARLEVEGAVNGSGFLTYQFSDGLITDSSFYNKIVLVGHVDTLWISDWYQEDLYLGWYPEKGTTGSLTIKLHGFTESID